MDTIDIINSIASNNKIDAMDKINDHLYAKAAEAMNSYKEVLAKSFFAAAEEEATENDTESQGTEE
jgi:hypothetical protein